MTAAVTPTEQPVGRRLLIRLALRRDRVMVPIWYAVLLLVCYASAASTQTLYSTAAERVQAAEAINASPGLVALYGPILDVHSTGELAMTKMTVLYATFVAVMLLFVVRRHTASGRGGRAGGADRWGGDDGCRAAAVGDRLRIRRVAGVWGCSPPAPTSPAASRSSGRSPSAPRGRASGLVGTGLTAVACQLSPSARTCAPSPSHGDRRAVRRSALSATPPTRPG